MEIISLGGSRMPPCFSCLFGFWILFCLTFPILWKVPPFPLDYGTSYLDYNSVKTWLKVYIQS